MSDANGTIAVVSRAAMQASGTMVVVNARMSKASGTLAVVTGSPPAAHLGAGRSLARFAMGTARPFARAGQLAKQQAKPQARPPPEPATDEDLYDSVSLPLQEMSDTWDVAMANARSDPFRVPCVQEAKAAGLLLPLRVLLASEIGEFAQAGLVTFMPQSPPSILHNAATVLRAPSTPAPKCRLSAGSARAWRRASFPRLR